MTCDDGNGAASQGDPVARDEPSREPRLDRESPLARHDPREADAGVPAECLGRQSRGLPLVARLSRDVCDLVLEAPPPRLALHVHGEPLTPQA